MNPLWIVLAICIVFMIFFAPALAPFKEDGSRGTWREWWGDRPWKH